MGFLIDQFHPPALGLPGRPEYTFARDEIWMAVTMRDGLGIPNWALWSLYIEGQIYIAVGGIVAIVWSRSWAVAILGVVAVIVAARLRANEWFWFYAPIWVLGSVPVVAPYSQATRLAACGSAMADRNRRLFIQPVRRPFSSASSALVGRTAVPRWFGLTHGVVAGAAIVAVMLFTMAFSLVFERPALRRKR